MLLFLAKTVMRESLIFEPRRRKKEKHFNRLRVSSSERLFTTRSLVGHDNKAYKFTVFEVLRNGFVL